MSDNVWITGSTVYGQQAIVALDHVVSVVEITADDKTTSMVRLRDKTHLELMMSVSEFWDLIPGVTTRPRAGKRT